MQITSTVFSMFHFLMSPFAQPADPNAPLLQTVRKHHLETAEGRLSFLQNELAPFVQQAERLNGEMMALARETEVLCPQAAEGEERTKTLALAQKVNDKMAELAPMLPHLQSALKINDDLLALDPILHKQGPLVPSEVEVLRRVADLCTYLDSRAAPKI